MNVANLLTMKGQPVVTIRPAQSVSDAVSLLAEKGVGALVVVDPEGKPIGIVTERHIVRRLAADDEVLTRTVGEVMSRDLLTTTPQDELSAVLHLMTERRIRHMPVLDGNALAGIVSLGDILRFQRDQYRGKVDTLETRIVGP
jgi:CBS domain-containing protein